MSAQTDPREPVTATAQDREAARSLVANWMDGLNNPPQTPLVEVIALALSAARARENKACAAVIDGWVETWAKFSNTIGAAAGRQLAAAIRARAREPREEQAR